MKSLHASFVLLTALVLQSCITLNEKDPNNQSGSQNPPSSKSLHMMQSVLWTQNAAEFEALSHQAFNVAKYRLGEMIEAHGDSEKPLAIVTDVDETVLDNSPYNAQLVLDDENYNRETWIEWSEKRDATPMPGALEFFNYANEQGVEIFYITNRYDTLRQATIDNMKKLGFPISDNSRVMTKDTTSAKGPRREIAQETHKIVMLLGDNLADFSSAFDDRSSEERSALVDSLKNEFGNRFIVLPNVMYGDWETEGLFESNYSYTEAQKDSVRRSKLRGYKKEN
ncbi:5'-nucleotidase, lipoprotein e(P4) family [Halocola ammonii]